MIPKRCINIDWLELYCLEDQTLYPMNADYYAQLGYYVVPREYGTRQYREMFTIYRQNEPWIEIRRNPVAGEETGRAKGMFSPYSCHIRLHNAACYLDFPVVEIEDFLFKNRYDVRRIYRLDIAMDFERFDKGDLPNDFLRRYMSGKYAKINQSNIAAHGRDMWDGRSWNSISWGNEKSMVSTKFYNKTLELSRPNHDKPYIRYAWMLCDLITNFQTMTKTTAKGITYKPEIWRVEFSIKSSAQGWYQLDKDSGRKHSSEMVPHNLNLYETREQLLTAFFSLAAHYFHFKKHIAGRRKYDCPDKELFVKEAGCEIYHIDRVISSRQPSLLIQRLKRQLENFQQTTLDIDVRIACQKIVEYLDRLILSNSMSTFSQKELKFLQVLLTLRLNSTLSYDEDRKRAEAIIESADRIF